MRLFILILPFVLSCAAIDSQHQNNPAFYNSTQEAANAADQAAQMHQHHMPAPTFP